MWNSGIANAEKRWSRPCDKGGCWMELMQVSERGLVGAGPRALCKDVDV